ncbi:hypothetical protein LHP98_19310, partial [Rhodobacter sp. Har01]|uniref:hypothetical protein n=1 Tax=Rhodobacter sp. Har01 TaxID=2883999 RepID=UPI001D05EF13
VHEIFTLTTKARHQMGDWKTDTVALLRACCAHASRSHNSALHRANCKAIDAMNAEAGGVPPDLLVYALVWREITSRQRIGGRLNPQTYAAPEKH